MSIKFAGKVVYNVIRFYLICLFIKYKMERTKTGDIFILKHN